MRPKRATRAPTARTWTVRLHLAPGERVVGATLDGAPVAVDHIAPLAADAADAAPRNGRGAAAARGRRRRARAAAIDRRALRRGEGRAGVSAALSMRRDIGEADGK